MIRAICFDVLYSFVLMYFGFMLRQLRFDFHLHQTKVYKNKSDKCLKKTEQNQYLLCFPLSFTFDFDLIFSISNLIIFLENSTSSRANLNEFKIVLIVLILFLNLIMRSKFFQSTNFTLLPFLMLIRIFCNESSFSSISIIIYLLNKMKNQIFFFKINFFFL